MKIKLDPTQRIFEAAAKEANRYAMHVVRLDLENGLARLSATDGRVLAMIEAEFEGDWPRDDAGEPTVFLLDARALKAGWKGGATRPKFLVLEEGVWTLEAPTPSVKIRTEIPVVDGDYPNTDAIVPDSSETDNRVTLNIAYLASLAKATGAETITLVFPSGFPEGPAGAGTRKKGYGSPVVVRARNSAGVIGDTTGIIMPVTSE